MRPLAIKRILDETYLLRLYYSATLIAGTSQINVSNTAPYDSEQYLVEDILLGNGGLCF